MAGITIGIIVGITVGTIIGMTVAKGIILTVRISDNGERGFYRGLQAFAPATVVYCAVCVRSALH